MATGVSLFEQYLQMTGIVLELQAPPNHQTTDSQLTKNFNVTQEVLIKTLKGEKMHLNIDENDVYPNKTYKYPVMKCTTDSIGTPFVLNRVRED